MIVATLIVRMLIFVGLVILAAIYLVLIGCCYVASRADRRLEQGKAQRAVRGNMDAQ